MSNQRVLVTAGAAGIGREIVRAFARGGASVFVCDIDAMGLGALAEEVVGLKTGTCDASNRKDMERMMGEAVQALGGLDVLVNKKSKAGVLGEHHVPCRRGRKEPPLLLATSSACLV